MRIVYFTDLFLPHVDGVTTSLINLCGGLVEAGHEVMVVAPKPASGRKVTCRGIEVVWLPSLPAAVYPEIRIGLLSPRVLAKIRRFKPDVVHVMTPGTIGGLGLVYAKVSRISSVSTFHGYFMGPELLGALGLKRGVGYVGRVLWRVARMFYDGCDVVVSPSAHVKRDLVKRGFEKRIEVCPHSLKRDFKVDVEKKKKFREKFGLGNKVGLYVGRLSTEKGVERLIYVWNRVVKEIGKAQLVIVGDGPERGRLEDLVKKLGIEERVVFVGEMKYRNLLESGVYELGRVYLSGSATEVQPMSVVEAISFGLPVVAFGVEGMEEIVDKNGYLVKQGDGEEFGKRVVELLEASGVRKKMGKESLMMAKRFDNTEVVAKYEKIYESLAD